MSEAEYQLSTGNGGWTCWQSADLGFPVFVRFRPTADGGQRLETAELYFGAVDEPITAANLRTIPLGMIEAWANDPEMRPLILASTNLPGPDLRRAAHAYATSYGSQADDHWVKQMLLAQVRGSGVPQAPDEPLPPLAPDVLDRRPLARPVRGGDLDQFYAEVAEQYRAAVRASIRPAVVLAQEAGVPVTTVHRWIREARRRKHLGAAQQGKAGVW